MISNAFSPVKKKPINNVSNIFNTSTAKGPVYSAPSYSSPKTVTASAQPKASYNYSTPTQPKTQQYAASGMNSSYASNPGNYVAPTQKPVIPQATPTAATGYMNTLQQSGDAQKALAEKMRADNANYRTSQTGLLNQGLDNSANEYKQNYDLFKENSEAGVRDIQASGETQKSNAKDYYGDAQLQAAKSRNQVRGETQRTFSNLNTLDSRGEGSFSQATENQDSQFNSFTQGNLKAQAQKLTEIDAQVGQATRAATLAVQQEGVKLQSLLSQIEIAKQNNQLDQAKSLTDAYNETQQRIYDIQDGIDNIKYQYQLEQEKFKQAQEQLSQETAGLSPEFLQNGQVKTMQDFIYRSKHPDMFEKIKPGEATAGGNNQNKALTLVNNLLNGNLNGISGGVRYGNVPLISQATGAATSQADYDGLKSLLALAERGQLKGSGAVSDFESKMLEKAALAGLNQNLPTDEFKRRLSLLQQDLMSGGASDSTQSGIDPAVAAYLAANGLQ